MNTAHLYCTDPELTEHGFRVVWRTPTMPAPAFAYFYARFKARQFVTGFRADHPTAAERVTP